MTDRRLPRHVAALTFDFWNTLYAAGNGSMNPVRPHRHEALRRLLATYGVSPGSETLSAAYRSGFDAYMAAWNRGEHFGAREQVLFMLDRFGLAVAAVDADHIADTARSIEDASLAAPLSLLPGVRETIAHLAAEGHALGLISDTSLTPGRILRHFLQKDGLLQHFSVLTFSDVTGYTKPDRRMFEQTLEAMGARPETTAHVGDTPRTDIAGAQALGMVTIRCAAAADHPESPHADLVIYDHREIPPFLRALRHP